VVVTAFSIADSSAGVHEAFPVFVAELIDRLATRREADAGSTANAVPPSGRWASDVNATLLPPDAADRTGTGEDSAVAAEALIALDERAWARWLLLGGLLFVALETWTRARGWTE
jgi:hypothetical protein